MFVGCFEISISVISKHVQSIGCIINIFSAWGGQKKLLGCGLPGGGSIPRLTLWIKRHLYPFTNKLHGISWMQLAASIESFKANSMDIIIELVTF